jgi:hypothetical protein
MASVMAGVVPQLSSFENKHPGRFDDLLNLLMEDVVVIEEVMAGRRLIQTHAVEA